MATLTLTIAAGGNAGSSLRAVGKAIEKAALNVPDVNGSGASVVMTIDNAPATGLASVVVTGAGLPTQPTILAG
jgi:hypothetical protein